MTQCFICRQNAPTDLIDIPFNSVCDDLLQMPWLKSVQQFPIPTCPICNGKALETIELSQKIKSLQLDLQWSRLDIIRTLQCNYGQPGEYVGPVERLGRMIAQLQSECSVKVQQSDPVYPMVTLREFDAGSQVNFHIKSETDSSSAGSPWLPEVNEGSNQEFNEGSSQDFNEESNEDFTEGSSQDFNEGPNQDFNEGSNTNEKKDLSVDCPHCGLTFERPNALIMHIRYKHPDKAPLDFPKRKKVRRAIDKNQKSVNCPHCDLTFQKPTALIIHMRFKHRDPDQVLLDLKCSYCDKTFASKRCRDNHEVAIHDKTTKFICDICGQACVSRSRLSSHLSSSHAEKTLKCSAPPQVNEGSNQEFNEGSNQDFNEGSNQDLNEQDSDQDPAFMPTVTTKPKKPNRARRPIDNKNEKNDLSVNCPHCGLTFQKPTALIIHIRYKHPGKTPLVFPKRKKLRQAIDKNDNSVNCPHCDLTFQKPTALTIHMRFKHRDPEQVLLDLKCSHCDKTFASKRSRDNHVLAIHDKSTNFICDICGQSCASRSRLSTHLSIHSHAEKTWKCSFCDLKFKTKYQLKHHEDRHSGRPSYVCEICGKAFYHLQALSRHKNSTHSTQSASCPQCGKVFQSIKHVRGHITRTHKQMWRKWVATAREKARKNLQESSNENNEETNKIPARQENIFHFQ